MKWLPWRRHGPSPEAKAALQDSQEAVQRAEVREQQASELHVRLAAHRTANRFDQMLLDAYRKEERA